MALVRSIRDAFANDRLKVPSTWIALVAMLLWLLSLSTRALVFYQRDASGLLVLLLGWGSLLGFVVAWFANLFFLWAFKRLVNRDQPALLLSWVALVVSADTIRFTVMYTDEGGGHTYLYGYGVGAALWFCSLFVMGMAASLRSVEMARRRSVRARTLEVASWASATALTIGLAAMLGVVMHVAGAQRRVAAPADKEYLTRAIFKRGAVCTIPDVRPLSTIRLAGPLVLDADKASPISYVSLLKWGVPTVRYKNVDYWLRDINDDSTVVTSPPQGDPAATLTVKAESFYEDAAWTELGDKYGTQVSATLTSATGSIAFAGKWRELRYFCPTFKPYGGEAEPPRSLLLDVLRTSTGERLRAAGASVGYPPSMWVNATNAIVTRGTSILKSTMASNPGCPADVGVLRPYQLKAGHQPISATLAAQDFTPEQVVQIGNSYHVWPPTWEVSMVCDGDTAYFAFGNQSTDGTYFYLEKRHLPDLRRAWSKVISVNLGSDFNSAGAVRLAYLQSVRMMGDRVVAIAAYGLPTDERLAVVTVDMAVPAGLQ